jgi:hypothetical protein
MKIKFYYNNWSSSPLWYLTPVLGLDYYVRQYCIYIGWLCFEVGIKFEVRK